MVKVSVVIPVFNAQKYIEQCLDSLLSQTLKEIQIICVDDGSEDDSVKMIARYAAKDNRIQLVRQENSYAGAARNNGLAHADGEYVMFLDADDFFEKDMLKEMYEKAKADNAQVCLCSGKAYDEQTGEYTYLKHYLNMAYMPKETPFSSYDIKGRIFNAVSPCPWTKMFEKSYILENGFKFQTTKKTNDLFFVYSALACADSITYINKAFINYRVGNTQSLQGNTGAVSTDFYIALSALQDFLKKRKLYKDFEQSFANRALSTCLYEFDKTVEKEKFFSLTEKLKTVYFYKLGVLGHSSGYFYIKKDFEKLISIMQETPEQLWQKKDSTAANSNDFSDDALDLSNWKSRVELSPGGIKVSVIIPVYNVEQYLAQCIDSVKNNSLKDIEIICVDDGSEDGSLDILKSFAQDDSRIKIISQKNGGLSSARNTGFKSAQGEYVLFLDSDDYLEPKALEYLYSEAVADDLDQLFFNASTFYDDGDNAEGLYIDYSRKVEYNGIMTGREMFVLMGENADFKPSACLQLNKRAFLKKNNISFVEGLIHEDNPFTIQCLFLSKRVRYIDIKLYNRRMRSNSIMTGSIGLKSSYNYYLVIKNIERIAAENRFSEDPAFYHALIQQIKRISASSADLLFNVTEEEFNHFFCSLDEKTAIEYYCMIKLVSELRCSNKDLSRVIKYSKEKELMDGFKWKCWAEEQKSKAAAEVAAAKAATAAAVAAAVEAAKKTEKPQESKLKRFARRFIKFIRKIIK